MTKTGKMDACRRKFNLLAAAGAIHNAKCIILIIITQNVQGEICSLLGNTVNNLCLIFQDIQTRRNNDYESNEI